MVLYGPKSSYGLQIVSIKPVEKYTIGSTNFNTAKSDYNNVVSKLNSRAGTYLNTTYATAARCVGSNPSNPNSDSPGYLTSTYDYMKNYTGQLKKQDTNYNTDMNKMRNLNIAQPSFYDDYYLASRETSGTSISHNFFVRYAYQNGMATSVRRKYNVYNQYRWYNRSFRYKKFTSSIYLKNYIEGYRWRRYVFKAISINTLIKNEKMELINF